MIAEGIAKIIGTEVLKIITNNTFKKLKISDFNIEKKEFDKVKHGFPELYANHFKEITKWAGSIPFIGLSNPKNTENNSIELVIASDIIKSTKKNKKKISEFNLLNSKENLLLIGAPGAGKTTTMKRLILRYLTEFNKIENSGFPILIRLREISPRTTLSKYLLDIFGIKYVNKAVEYEIKDRKFDKENGRYYEKIRIQKKLECFVGEESIESFVVKFLNQTNCFLMLDGLDELDKSIQLSTLREIERIGLLLDKSKILVTVRKSEINKIIQNFSTLEIASLSSNQIGHIAEKWVDDKNKFLDELNKKPYKDLANRPIFLTFLLIIFERYSNLPSQPSEIYEDTTYLVMKEWDEHRDVIRTSKYADFNTRKKLKFLSEISYYLTYKVKQKIFSTKDLENIYINIHEKYGLPCDEMKDVILEIESHTGIIIESRYKKLEFSHLSIQEFLCAKHLVNLPYSKETITYFLEYPEPIAIAICISSEPSMWFSNLILNNSLNINNFKKNKNEYLSSIYTLLNRLLTESPSFKACPELGYTFFYIISNLYIESKDFSTLLDQWFNYPAIMESISISLKGSNCVNTYNGSYLISKKTPTVTNYFLNVPYMGKLPDNFVNTLLKKKLIAINNEIVS